MDWLVYALICAFLTGSASLVHKKALIKQHAMQYSATLAFIALIFTLPIYLLIDYSRLELVPIVIAFFVSIFGSVAFLLVAKGLRHMELSAAAPLLVLGPVFSAILAYFVLGEALTPMQILGVIVVLAGAYVLEVHDLHHLLHPFQNVEHRKYGGLIITALLLYAVGSVGDRMILSHYGMQPLAFTAITHTFMAINFLILISIFYDGFKGIRRGIQEAGPWITLVAILTVGYRIAQAQAVKLAFVGLVLPIKRMSSFFVTLIGGNIFHEEKIARKSIACLIMVTGVVLIAI